LKKNSGIRIQREELQELQEFRGCRIENAHFSKNSETEACDANILSQNPFKLSPATPELLSNSEVRRAPVASQIFTPLARGVLLDSEF
jgi:hypothetical protein